MFGQNTELSKRKLATPNKERLAYNVYHYNLNVMVDPAQKRIDGWVDIQFTWLNAAHIIGFDLDDAFKIDKVLYNNKEVSFIRTPQTREVLVEIEQPGDSLALGTLSVYYGGQPQEALNAPWDGGFSWKKDKKNRTWVGVSCEGDGASVWWPNKDLLSDEPDSVTFTCKYPSELLFVANGDMQNDVIDGKHRTTTWKTTLPINNYNVTLNLGHYSHIEKEYKRENSTVLRLDYYVLDYNKAKAEKHFTIVEPMMQIFEEAFGKYPFSNDGYALVETPYLGMEHQSAIAYGNKYLPGYLGRFPKNMDFDFIVIHETGHEWWGNSVSMKDRADMWIHESFCTYSEAIFAEQYYGYEDMLDYLVYQKRLITHKGPIQGVPHTHESGYGTEIYYKGSWVLHTLRNMVRNDKLWFGMIKDLAKKHRIDVVEGKEVKAFMSEYLKMDLDAFFKLYFNSTNIPKVVYKKGKDLKIKLDKDYGFELPLEIDGKIYMLSHKWIKINGISKKDLQTYLHRRFLIEMD